MPSGTVFSACAFAENFFVSATNDFEESSNAPARVYVGSAGVERVRAECKRSGKHVRYVTHRAADERGQREFKLLRFDVHVFQNARKSRHRKCDGVIQKELRGVNDVRILQRLQNAVYEADEQAFLCAVDIREKHDGKKRNKRYAAALRQIPEFDIRKRER